MSQHSTRQSLTCNLWYQCAYDRNELYQRKLDNRSCSRARKQGVESEPKHHRATNIQTLCSIASARQVINDWNAWDRVTRARKVCGTRFESDISKAQEEQVRNCIQPNWNSYLVRNDGHCYLKQRSCSDLISFSVRLIQLDKWWARNRVAVKRGLTIDRCKRPT